MHSFSSSFSSDADDEADNEELLGAEDAVDGGDQANAAAAVVPAAGAAAAGDAAGAARAAGGNNRAQVAVAQDWNPVIEWDRGAEDITWERVSPVFLVVLSFVLKLLFYLFRFSAWTAPLPSWRTSSG